MVMVTTITMTISYIAFAGLDEGRAGTDIDHKRMFGINVLAMLLLPKQQNGKHSLMPCSNQGCGLLTSLEELTYLLHATLAPRLSRNCIKKYQRKNKQEGNNFDTRKGRKEGRQAGRKEGRQAGRKEGRKE